MMGRTSGPALVPAEEGGPRTAQDMRLRNSGSSSSSSSNRSSSTLPAGVEALEGIAASVVKGKHLSPFARQTLLDALPPPLAKAVRPVLDLKPIITRAQLRALIASTPQIPSASAGGAAGGGVLILFNRLILNPSDFLPAHPGGELALLHFVGRDAQDEIEAYHSDVALRQMAGWVVGILDEADWLGTLTSGKEDSETDATKLERGGYVPLVPPVQLGYRAGVLEAPHAQAAALTHLPAPLSHTRPNHFPLPPAMLEPPPPPVSSGLQPERERTMSQAYRALHKQIAKDGWYTLRPSGYARECTRYALLGSTAAYLYYLGMERPSIGQAQSPLLLFLSSVFLGLFWHQLTFSAHDAGHHGITHSPLFDRLIGITIADLIGGLSIGWWCDNHDVHHLVTNHPEHDPDIQHMPFFAISGRFVAPDAVDDGEDGEGDGEGTGTGTSTSQQAVFVPEGLWSSYYRRILAFDAPARVFLKYQHQLYYIVMSLGRFNLYANSYGFLAKRAWKLAFPGKNGGALGGEGAGGAASSTPLPSQGVEVLAELRGEDAAVVKKILHPRQQRGSKPQRGHRQRDGWKLFNLLLEVSCLVVFWTWFGAGVIGSIRGWGWRVMYVLVSHIVTSPLHVQIVLSHFAQSSVDLGLFESFPSRQLRTTMDVLCPPALDFLHGGLHMQVTHHLFPRIPRHNLRPVRDRYVRPFADEWGARIADSASASSSSPSTSFRGPASMKGGDSRTPSSLYSEYTFGDGNRRVLGVLAEVARQVRVLGQVAEAQAKGTLHHHGRAVAAADVRTGGGKVDAGNSSSASASDSE